MGDLPQRVRPDPDGRYTVDVHVTPDGRARIGGRTYSPEEFAEVLRRNPGYDGRPIRLIGCDAGSNDFAKRLSRELNTPVMAPSKPAWTDSNGRVFSSDYEIGPDGKPRPKIPPNGQWDTHHPDGTTSRASNDGFTPDTPDANKQYLDPNDAKDRSGRNSDEGSTDEDTRPGHLKGKLEEWVYGDKRPGFAAKTKHDTFLAADQRADGTLVCATTGQTLEVRRDKNGDPQFYEYNAWCHRVSAPAGL